jgi:MFS transporter, DHA1 family, multidrug resistance protein
VLRLRQFVGYMLTAALSGFTMMAYIANSSYVLQEMKGVAPLPFAPVLRLHGSGTDPAVHPQRQDRRPPLPAPHADRVRPRPRHGRRRRPDRRGGPARHPAGPHLRRIPGPDGSPAFIFGNANALAAVQVPHIAGAASAVLGVTQAVALATSAPIASSGGATTAVPMIFVMIVGIAGSLFSYLVLARRRSNPAAGPRSTVLSKSS